MSGLGPNFQAKEANLSGQEEVSSGMTQGVLWWVEQMGPFFG